MLVVVLCNLLIALYVCLHSDVLFQQLRCFEDVAKPGLLSTAANKCKIFHRLVKQQVQKMMGSLHYTFTADPYGEGILNDCQHYFELGTKV